VIVAALVAVAAVIVVGVSAAYVWPWHPWLGIVGVKPYGGFGMMSNASPSWPWQAIRRGVGGNMMGGWQGMMGWSMMGGCPCWGYPPSQGATGQRLSIDQVQQIVENYAAGLGNNFEIHEIMEFQQNFYVIAVERDTGIGAFELLVNPYTGLVTPEPGPNMMWNTKYGMHAQMMGQWTTPTADLPITPAQAKQAALNYLQAYFGEAVEVKEPMPFYGYYTLDFGVDGRTYGMLSVNGYTGQVWYHQWHGQFIQERELTEEH